MPPGPGPEPSAPPPRPPNPRPATNGAPSPGWTRHLLPAGRPGSPGSPGPDDRGPNGHGANSANSPAHGPGFHDTGRATGLLPAPRARARPATAPDRTPGRHDAHRDTPPPGHTRQEYRGLSRAAVRLDGPALESLLDGCLARHGLITGWEEVVSPALHAVGRKWSSAGDRYVAVEHLLSWHVSCALRRVRTLAAPADVPPAVLACVPGEQHSLPIEALAAALGERALPTRMFGAAVPAEALTSAVQRIGPSAVVLWAQSRDTADRALVTRLTGVGWGLRGARTRPAVYLAGPGWSGTATQPGTARLTGLGSAVLTLTHALTR
nr:B12-binding domain-containing protein [Streptomyces sp. SM14]